MTVSGNHEGVSSNNTYKKIFAIPSNGPKTSDNVLDGEFYCFDCGEARFVMMDSSFLTDDRMEAIGRQEWKAVEGSVEKWLGHTLDSGGKEWLITVVHHPVYGMHEGDYVSRRIRRLWAPIMEKGRCRYGVLRTSAYVYENEKYKRNSIYHGQFRHEDQ